MDEEHDCDFESDDSDYGSENDDSDLESINSTHDLFRTREIEGRRYIYYLSCENIKEVVFHPTLIINFPTISKNCSGKRSWNLL